MYFLDKTGAPFFGRVGDDDGGVSQLALNSIWDSYDNGAGGFAPSAEFFAPEIAPIASKPDLGPLYASTSNSMTYFSEVLIVTGTYGPGDTIPDGLAITHSYVTLKDFGTKADIESVASVSFSSSDSDSIFSIGQVAIGTMPEYYAIFLNTDIGVISSYVFTFGGQTYMMPRSTESFDTVTVTSGTSTAGTTALQSVSADVFLRSHDSLQFEGTAFFEREDSGGTVIDSGTDGMTIWDENFDVAVVHFDIEQLFITDIRERADYETMTEGVSTVSHSGGIVAGIDTVRVSDSDGAGGTYFYYLFNTAQLAVAGLTLSDIIGVGTFTAGAQGTTGWEDFGFTVQALDALGTVDDDVTSGTDLNDTFAGTDGDDTLSGLDGNDIFGAGDGADTMDGGEGNVDRINYSNNSVGITVYSDGITAGTGGDAEGDILSNIERITGTDFDDVIYSSASADALLRGGDGNDMLYGAHTGASLSGEDGDDSLIYTTDLMTGTGSASIVALGGIGTDELVIAGSIDTSLTFGDDLYFSTRSSLADIEGIRFDALDASTDLTFHILDDDLAFLQGQSWDVTGDASNSGTEEIIIEMESAFWGATTSIDLSGWNLTDWESGQVTVNGIVGQDITIIGTSGRDILTGFTGDDNFTGGDGDDVIYGNAGSDVINAGAGDDWVSGGFQSDQMDGGDGIDIVDFTFSNLDRTVDFTTGLAYVTANGPGTETIANFENATLGDGNDVIIGDAEENVLTAGAGDDTLDGGDGNDRLFGQDGDDILMGGANNDFLYGGIGNDELHGGEQTDRLFGSDGNDDLYGDGNNDIMYGGGNVDYLYGGLGNDNINGGSNVDYLFGEDNNDVIYGGNAPDRIDGGSGNDTLYGGNRGGNDISGDFFIFSNNFGTDTIMDFQDGLDMIDFSGHTAINNFADVLARASEDGTSLLIATNAANTLIIENFSLAELDASDFVF